MRTEAIAEAVDGFRTFVKEVTLNASGKMLPVARLELTVPDVMEPDVLEELSRLADTLIFAAGQRIAESGISQSVSVRNWRSADGQ